MDKYVAQENSSFVLHLGDNMYPDGVDSVDDSQWRESFLNIYGGIVRRSTMVCDTWQP